MRTFLIAECASTHDGDLQKAMQLIAIAKAAGCDCVKFQYWSDAGKLADRRNVEPHYREIYRKYQVPQDWLAILAGECRIQGIEFLCTVYLQEDISVMAPLVKRFKVSSFEAGNYEFIRAHARFGKSLIISTGMMDGTEAINAAICASEEENGCIMLHCVSAYPCESMDLTVLNKMPFRGISDHTANNLTGALAVAAGAEVIEVHFRHPDTDPTNPDYAVAVPDLAEYVRLVRFAEAYRGDGIKRMRPEEAPMAKYRVKG